MIAGCTVVELRADRTPGEQAQGCYVRLRGAGVSVPNARAHAAAASRDARRNAAEHTRQGLITERFAHAPFRVCQLDQ